MKKRFAKNPRMRSQTSRDRFCVSTSDEAADLIKAKKVRFKEAETVANHPPNHRFDACSTPCEMEEAPQSSSNAKTSEYAFFKRLKQNVGHTSSVNKVNRKNVLSCSFRPSNISEEVGSSKYKDIYSSSHIEKFNTCKIPSFQSPKDAALESKEMTSKLPEDQERFKSPVPIKTPKTIDLETFLSINAGAPAEPEIQGRDQDIFSFKRMKLRQQIVKTLFPEADAVPKECNLVSLLLHRLLPENCANTQSESLNLSQREVEDRSELHILPGSNMQFEENRETSRTLLMSKDGDFLGDCCTSPAWCHKLRERFPSCEIVEDLNNSAVGSVDRMLLGYTGNNEGSSLNDADDDSWSSRLGDGNLLMWRYEDYDNPSESWSNSLEERNVLQWRNAVYECSTPCSTNHDILKSDKHYQFSCHDVSSPHFYRFGDRAHQYGNPYGNHDSVAASIYTEESALSYLDSIPGLDMNNRLLLCSDHWCNSEVQGLTGRYGPSNSIDLKGHAESNHPTNFKFEREPSPLLLCWGTQELEMQQSSHTNLELDLYSPSIGSEDHLLGQESRNAMEIYPSSSYCSYKFEDQVIQRCAPLPLSCGPEQPNLYDAGFFKNIFSDSHLFMLPLKHFPSTGNIGGESYCPSAEHLLLPQSSDFDQGLKFNYPNRFSEKQDDISTDDDDILQLLGRGNPNSQLVTENQNIFRREKLSLMSVQIPGGRDVSLPSRLRGVRWLDREDETYSDDNRAMDKYM